MLTTINGSVRKFAVKILGRRLSESERHIQLIRRSGVVSDEWYFSTYPDLDSAEVDACSHFYFQGAVEGRNPSYLFDCCWYLEMNPDVAKAQIHPLLHYVLNGEKEGRAPSTYFDPRFYARHIDQSQISTTLLGHYLAGGWREHAPNRYFDNKYYLATYDDVLDAGIDPLLHYINQGWREDRETSPRYSLPAYRKALDKRDQRECDPLRHYLQIGQTSGLLLPERLGQDCSESEHGERSGDTSVLFCLLKQYQSPGQDFEQELMGGEASAVLAKARLFAFYLPQFYSFAENDKWWGTGFTEWRNVTRALPRFNGHYQPRLPRDLGFYDLQNIDTINRQVEIARKSGIAGFCFYYYWFGGKRLLDKPLDLFLREGVDDFPFCLMWANENWTRRWDGLENDVLIGQDYSPSDDEVFVADLAAYFNDPRYERVDGRPLFFIYRPGIIPEFQERLASWRSLFLEQHGLEPLMLMAQCFGDHDPSVFGLDGAIEFPPHKLAVNLNPVNERLDIIDPEFQGHYLAYDDLVKSSLEVATPEYELIRTLVPSWDNEARKPARGMGFVGATPAKYEQWLRELVRSANDHPFLQKIPYVFINAWNEWAEGAYLEPDLHHGCAYLNATFRGVTGLRLIRPGTRILLVGHDAYLHGAQLLMLNIMRTLKQDFGMEVTLLLLHGGPLVEDYREIGRVIIADEEQPGLRGLVDKIVIETHSQLAICNTVVTGDVVKILSERGVATISLVHELSRLIVERGFEGMAKNLADFADKVIFAAEFVRSSFEEIAGELGDKAVLQPQGIYQQVEFNPYRDASLKTRLGLPDHARIVFNLGFGDLRKGFDLYLNLVKIVAAQVDDVHFVWLGEIEASILHWLRVDLECEPLKSRLHVLPFDREVNAYLNGVDILALTSREDPFPSVVLEALACGLPVVAFEGGGGYVEAIRAHSSNGRICPMGDVQRMAQDILQLLESDTSLLQAERADAASTRYNWKDYSYSLMRNLMPGLRKVSVIVPNYNYACYLVARLDSILEQDYPVYEIIVLDDCSTDESLLVLKEYIQRCGRKIRVVANESNSGSVFRQWQRGIDLAQGDYIWIAEADDLSSPDFLSGLLAKFNDSTTLGFADSVQIDEYGNTIGESYRFYYEDLPERLFDKSFNMDGRDFLRSTLAIKNVILNVSSVVFRRDALVDVFQRSAEEITGFRMAGDWYLYSSILSVPGASIAFDNKASNMHRRHSRSVTHALNAERHVEEIRRVQRYVAEQLSDEELPAVYVKKYLQQVSEQLLGRNLP